MADKPSREALPVALGAKAAGRATRPNEEGAVDDFLVAASHAPSALIIEGEPGIGKTTLWSTARRNARDRGFRVLSARATAAESVLAYTALTELLSDLEPAIWSVLPPPQRIAVDQILSRTRLPGAATDQRAVAAAFLGIIEMLVDDGPLLLSVDDVQWLDPSSVHVLAYAARRLTGPVGFLGAVRTEEGRGDAAAWFQLHRPDAVSRLALRPLSSRALQTVVAEHLGRAIPRAQMDRIYQMSGGNPFYAIELARAFDGSVAKFLPGNLAELIRARIDDLEPDVQGPLLAAACVSTPTVDVVAAAAATDHDRVLELLEIAEHQGLILIEGNRIHFTHPLLATGVYTNASAEQRRQMHRSLADVVDETELRARHLALAATDGDPETLQALDDATATAQARGAPAAAAELLELAITLGGDCAERRIRLAANYFDGGDPARARALLERTIEGVPPGPVRAEARYMLAIVRFIDDGYLEASQLLQHALTEDHPAPAVKAKTLTALAHAQYNIGEPDAAGDRAAEAVKCAELLDDPALLSQALAVRATLHFLRGDGIDEPGLRKALELEDTEASTPTVLQPSVLYALQLGWTGRLDESYERMQSIQRRCIERGDEGDLIFIDFQAVLNRIWRGDFVEASRISDEAMELARQLGGEFPLMLGLLVKACIAVHTGCEDDARPAVEAAVDATKRSGTAWHVEWSLTALGFLETSLGNYDPAINALEPLLARFVHAPNTAEIFAASFVPDAVEALVELGRVAEAEPLVAALEHNGRRLDRPWMLAVGARCRAMVAAASGDLSAALSATEAALVHHDDLLMPFERARTELLLGQLQRRQRQPAAATSLRGALTAFERLGTPLWADRARSLLTGADARPDVLVRLSDAERRVAEMAASGMTNRDVAEALFISAKTVEATLARVYRKLSIRSRAELGRTMGRTTT